MISLTHLQSQAEDLKAELWVFLEGHKLHHPGVKDAMNELLDLIDELEDLMEEKDE